MQRTLAILAVSSVLGLAACGNSDLERGVTGAAIGTLAGTAVGDPGMGLVIGGAAGVLCDNVNLCR